MTYRNVERVHKLNMVALALVFTYAIFMIELLSQITIVSKFIDSFFIYITSVGFYKILVNFIYKITESIPLLMRLYWGKYYLDGFWAYWYTLEDDVQNKVHFGIWKIEQDLYCTKVLGYGLSDDFQIRSNVRSITDFTDYGNSVEVINVRCDSVNSASDFYSRTTMYFEMRKSIILRHPHRMKGKTYIHGGPRNGKICNNSFLKYEKAKTEQEVIEKIRNNINVYGCVFEPNNKGKEKDEMAGIVREI